MPAKPSKQAANTTITLPALKKGEHYAGIVVADGEPAHHVVLLPGDKDKLDFAAANAWAEKQGGELPTRREQSLLFANCKDQFKASWYWSAEKHASDASDAWCQGFGFGTQFYSGVDTTMRARAVRRVAI